MAQFTGLRGSIIIKAGFEEPYFVDIDAYFASLKTEIDKYLSAYTNSFDLATRVWTFNWTIIDADEFINILMTLPIAEFAEFVETIVNLEIYYGNKWHTVKNANGKLQFLP